MTFRYEFKVGKRWEKGGKKVERFFMMLKLSCNFPKTEKGACPMRVCTFCKLKV